MRLVVVESPYAGEVQANVAYARAGMRGGIEMAKVYGRTIEYRTLPA